MVLLTLMQKHRSLPHNPNIANTFFRAGFIESWGRGIEKICTICKNYGIAEPVYTVHPGDIMLMFSANQSATQKNIENNVVENVVENKENVVENKENVVENILKSILKVPSISTKELATMYSLSARQVQRIMTKMKDQGLIRRVGPDKGGHWEVINNN